MSTGASIGSKTKIIVTGSAVGALTGDLLPLHPVNQPPGSGIMVSGSIIVQILSVSDWKSLTNSVVGSVSVSLPNGPISLSLTDTSTPIDFHQIAMSELNKTTNIPVDPSRVTIVTSGNNVLIVIDNVNLPSSPASPIPSNVTMQNITNLSSLPLISINPNECKYYYFVVPPDTVRLTLYAAIQSAITLDKGLIIYISSGRIPSSVDNDCSSPLLNDNHEYSFNWRFTSEVTKKGSFNGGSLSHPLSSVCNKEMYLGNQWGVAVCATTELTYYFQVQSVQLPAIQIPEEVESSALTIVPWHMTFIIFFMLFLIKII
jgi:hypothetical protein